MRKLVFGVALLVCAFWGALAQAEPAGESAFDRIMRTGTLRCGYLVWPPFIKVDANSGQLSGINYDYMEAIGAELGLKIDWVEEVGVGDYIQGLNGNRFDVMCATVWPDPGRVRQTLMSVPVMYSAIFPVVRADDHRFDGGLDTIDTPATSVVGIEGDMTADIARRHFGKAKLVALPQASDGSQMIMSLVTGKADVAFLDRSVVRDYIATNGPKIRILSEETPVRVFPEFLSVRRGEAGLKNMLDTMIFTLNANGLADRILGHYETSSWPPVLPYSLKTQ